MQNKTGQRYTPCPRQKSHTIPIHLLTKPWLYTCVIHLWNSQVLFPFFGFNQLSVLILLSAQGAQSRFLARVLLHMDRWSSHKITWWNHANKSSQTMSVFGLPKLWTYSACTNCQVFQITKEIAPLQILTCCPTASPSLNYQVLPVPKRLLILQVVSNLGTVLLFLCFATAWKSYPHGRNKINCKPVARM